MPADPHVVAVGDGADAEQQQPGAEQLVAHPAPEREVRRRVGPEDGGRVRGGAVPPAVVLVPDQRVPVHQEHGGAGEEGAEVLRGQVVRHAAPRELAEGGERHGDRGVDVAAGHLPAQQQAEHRADTPPDNCAEP